MAILLTILKIIGIILLVVLGILILLILLILFVPIRYRIHGDGSYIKDHKKPLDYHLEVKVTWLLHMISIPVLLDETGFGAKAKIFGIPVIRIGNQKKEKKKKPEKKKKQSEPKVIEVSEIPEAPVSEKPAEEPVLPEISAAAPAKTTEKEVQAIKKTPGTTQIPEADKVPEADDSGEKRKNIFEKFTEKASAVFLKVKAKLKSLKEKITGILNKIRRILDKVEVIKDFLAEEKNQEIFLLVFDRLIRMLKHFFPRNPDGRIEFALDDPCLTGKILSFLSLIYPVAAEHFEIYPDFGEYFYVKGRLNLKGHIRICHVLGLALGLILKKKFRAFLKRVKVLIHSL